MTYPSGAKAEAQLFLHTIKSSFAFTGRARRTEVLLYHIFSALAGVVLGFVGGVVLPQAIAGPLIALFQLIAFVPMVALFARRLHDQSRSNFWLIILPIGVGLSHFQGQFCGTTAVFTRVYNLAHIAVVILLLALLYWPGTKGPNAYGPDPRQP
ncbi:uncharacterized membrane protein YhaH (DUF805 family) [Sphingobium fontiphilum]|uniref:Uncharacterized membrane protein YhaH (DUF805 family) n=1 Tax=Sphingobium fontiphilum TaxID=944425 RepID=A0A7W6DEW4_9SPHN|nr:DUF805 domain-containing protein [Sphingobium fontiphilum]MBB3981487.1 uncharacterized membrane protein YhaH (DUF805 family) [Sphingobium fontiphilum]